MMTATRPLPPLAVVGPGRLGRSLQALLARRGIEVPLLGREDPLPTSRALVLTVPDRALPSMVPALPAGAVVLHCSGAAEVEVLRPHQPAGSWHPLMTFPGPEVALPHLDGVPAAVAGDPEALQVARSLTDALGMTPLEVSGDRRLYHASAVLAGNLATVLLAEASRALEATGLDPEQARRALLPLARRSLENAVADPAAALTGPVPRGDLATLAGHREALREAHLQELIPLVDLLEERGGRLWRRGRRTDEER